MMILDLLLSTFPQACHLCFNMILFFFWHKNVQKIYIVLPTKKIIRNDLYFRVIEIYNW